MAADLALKVIIRIYCGDEIAMGPGKADLLDAIDGHGSISAAARSLGMSYRRAWLLVDTMNRCWKEPLVATSPGSAHGGARVTEAGRLILADYRALQGRVLQSVACSEYQALADAVLPSPRPGRTPPAL